MPLAGFADSIPYVLSDADRAARFPAPPKNFRVQYPDGTFKKYAGGGVWQAFGATSQSLAKLSSQFLVADSVADDRAALDTLVNVTMQPDGGELDVVGVPRIGSNLTIPRNVRVNFRNGAYISPDLGVTVTILGGIRNGRDKIFGGAGSVSFRDTSAQEFAAKTERALPEWWGAGPGDNSAAPLNSGPGIQAACRSGVNRISLNGGAYFLLTNLVIDDACASDIVFEGNSRTGSYLVAGPAAGSYGAINAMIVNKQNNGKLSWERMRWAGSGFGTPAFLGYAIYCLEDGLNSQAIFSGYMTRCWGGLGTSAAGFLYGAINNFYVSDCTFEGMQCRFKLVGAGSGDVHFQNISDYSCLDSFLDMATDATLKNLISVRGLHAYSPQRGPLIKANNVESLTLASITYQVNDASVPGTTLGLMDLTTCSHLSVGNCKALRYAGSAANMNQAVKLNACSGLIDNLYVDGSDMNLAIQGAVDLTFSNTTLINPASFNLRFVAATSGRVKFTAGSRLQYSGNGCVNFQTVGSTLDLTFEDTDCLDPLWNAGVAGYGSYYSTTGRVRHINGRIGRTNAASNVNRYLYLDGAGTFSIEGTELLDVSVILLHAASTQGIASQRWLNTKTGRVTRGDVAGASTQFTDPDYIHYNVALTANRVHTFNWIAGIPDRKRIVRTGGGAFNLDVGGLKTLVGAPAAFAEVYWDGAVATLVDYGLL